MVIGFDLALLANRTESHIDHLSSNLFGGHKLYVKLKQEFDAI